MSKLVYILPLVLLLSLHACNARDLSLTGKRNGRKSQKFVKDIHSTELLSPSIFTHLEPKVVQAREEHTAGAKEHTNTVRGKVIELIILKKDDKKGGEVEKSHLKEATQGWRRQARSTIETSPNEASETANSKENEIVDDVVAMDYAQPHRKPPIHNRKLLTSFIDNSHG